MARYRASLGSFISELSSDVQAARTEMMAGRLLRHCTTNTVISNPPSGTTWGPGIFSVNAAKSTDTSFLSFPANDKIQLHEPGLYAIHFLFLTHSVNSDGALAALWNETEGTVITGSNKHANGGLWEFPLTMPNFFTPTPTMLRINFAQSSGVTQQWDTTLHITKLY